MGHFAHHPLGQRHLVGGAHDVDGQELDFLLNRLNAVGDEVADLRVGVLHRASHLREVIERLSAHLLPFREGRGLVVPALRLDREQTLLRREQVVLELAEGFEPAARRVLQSVLRLAQNLLRRAGQRISIDVVEPAHDVEARDRIEGIEKRGAQLRHDVKVRADGIDEIEERGAVHALPHRQHPLEVGGGLNRKVEGFEPAVAADVTEVEHRYVALADESKDVGPRELLRGLSEVLDERVWIQSQRIGLEHVFLLAAGRRRTDAVYSELAG